MRTSRRPEHAPPPGGPTKNETACLGVLEREQPDIALSTSQIASQASISTSSATVALLRLTERGLVRRHEPRGVEPVRWSRTDRQRSAA